MPGAPFMFTSDSYQGVMGEGVPQAAVGAPAAGIGWSFWLIAAADERLPVGLEVAVLDRVVLVKACRPQRSHVE